MELNTSGFFLYYFCWFMNGQDEEKFNHIVFTVVVFIDC